jgi:hypothetical protein
MSGSVGTIQISNKQNKFVINSDTSSSLLDLHQLLKKKFNTKRKWTGLVACIKENKLIICNPFEKETTMKLPQRDQEKAYCVIRNGNIAASSTK